MAATIFFLNSDIFSFIVDCTSLLQNGEKPKVAIIFVNSDGNINKDFFNVFFLIIVYDVLNMISINTKL